MNNITRAEIIFAARIGKSHASCIIYKNSEGEIVDVEPKTIMRSVSKAATLTLTLSLGCAQENNITWSVIALSRPNADVYANYQFEAPGIEEIRSRMLAEMERKEFSALSKKSRKMNH